MRWKKYLKKDCRKIHRNFSSAVDLFYSSILLRVSPYIFFISCFEFFYLHPELQKLQFFCSPSTYVLRLSILEEWPWAEIVISLAILIISVWIFMKLAGKIFKVGILMYGKNATPKEIWSWIRQ